MGPEVSTRTCVCTCLYEFVYTTIDCKSNKNIHKHSSKFNKKSSHHPAKFNQNRPKINQKWIQSRSKIGSRSDFASETHFGSILAPFLVRTWGHLGGQVGAMLVKKLMFGGSRRHAKTTMISNTFRGPLGTNSGTILGSKIEAKSVQDRSQERS